MDDEPILCFDGDDAGRRAAYRALDLALPLLKPGKSLKFATLPDGQDPDDLARSGGRDAIEDVLGAARPLAHMLWARETEQGPFDTPERRAALEARISEVTAAIADESVRRYYRQDFSDAAAHKCSRRCNRDAPAQFRRPHYGDRNFTPASAASPGARQRPPAPRRRFGDETPYVAASPQLAASPLHRGHRAAIPRREALILQAALNYPWLLHDHMEELADAEFRHADTQKLKGALIDVFAHHSAGEFADGGTDGRPRGACRGARPPRLCRAPCPHRAHHHHALGLGRGAGSRAGRCFADLEAACCLASAMAFPI